MHLHAEYLSNDLTEFLISIYIGPLALPLPLLSMLHVSNNLITLHLDSTMHLYAEYLSNNLPTL